MLKMFQVNMSFSEILANIPASVRFLKEIVSNKKIFEDFAMVSLTKECSAVIQNHLSIKVKDLGSFTMPC